MSELTAVGKQIILEQDKAEETTTKSGIILPEKKRPSLATIISVGPNVEDKENLKVGARVVIEGGYGSDTKELFDKEYLFTTEEHIFAVVKGGK